MQPQSSQLVFPVSTTGSLQPGPVANNPRLYYQSAIPGHPNHQYPTGAIARASGNEGPPRNHHHHPAPYVVNAQAAAGPLIIDVGELTAPGEGKSDDQHWQAIEVQSSTASGGVTPNEEKVSADGNPRKDHSDRGLQSVSDDSEGYTVSSQTGAPVVKSAGASLPLADGKDSHEPPSGRDRSEGATKPNPPPHFLQKLFAAIPDFYRQPMFEISSPTRQSLSKLLLTPLTVILLIGYSLYVVYDYHTNLMVTTRTQVVSEGCVTLGRFHFTKSHMKLLTISSINEHGERAIQHLVPGSLSDDLSICHGVEGYVEFSVPRDVTLRTTGTRIVGYAFYPYQNWRYVEIYHQALMTIVHVLTMSVVTSYPQEAINLQWVVSLDGIMYRGMYADGSPTIHKATMAQDSLRIINLENVPLSSAFINQQGEFLQGRNEIVHYVDSTQSLGLFWRGERVSVWKPEITITGRSATVKQLSTVAYIKYMLFVPGATNEYTEVELDLPPNTYVRRLRVSHRLQLMNSVLYLLTDNAYNVYGVKVQLTGGLQASVQFHFQTLPADLWFFDGQVYFCLLSREIYRWDTVHGSTYETPIKFPADKVYAVSASISLGNYIYFGFSMYPARVERFTQTSDELISTGAVEFENDELFIQDIIPTNDGLYVLVSSDFGGAGEDRLIYVSWDMTVTAKGLGELIPGEGLTVEQSESFPSGSTLNSYLYTETEVLGKYHNASLTYTAPSLHATACRACTRFNLGNVEAQTTVSRPYSIPDAFAKIGGFVSLVFGVVGLSVKGFAAVYGWCKRRKG